MVFKRDPMAMLRPEMKSMNVKQEIDLVNLLNGLVRKNEEMEKQVQVG